MSKINKDKNIILSKYSLDGGNTLTDMPDDDIIQGTIDLRNTGEALATEDNVLIRVYWKWYEDITNPVFNDTNTSIGVTVLVMQKV